MKVTLVVKETGKSIDVPKETSILGRLSGCDITIPDKCVSKEHCLIRQGIRTVNIEDLGSKNHTEVPGKTLMEKGDGATLKHGDTFKVGNTKLIIQIDDQPLPKVDDAPIKPTPADDTLSDSAIARKIAKDEQPKDKDEINLNEDSGLQLKPKENAGEGDENASKE